VLQVKEVPVGTDAITKCPFKSHVSMPSKITIVGCACVPTLKWCGCAVLTVIVPEEFLEIDVISCVLLNRPVAALETVPVPVAAATAKVT
jgi:hypothetical protein